MTNQEAREKTAQDTIAEALADAILKDRALFGSLHGTAIRLPRYEVARILRDGLTALAADGWAVVRVEWEWFEGKRRRKAIPANSWEPVPEDSEQ